MNKREREVLDDILERVESGNPNRSALQSLQKLRDLLAAERRSPITKPLPLQPGDWVVMAETGRDTFEIKQTRDGKERHWWQRATRSEEDAGKALRAKLKAENELAFEVAKHDERVAALERKIEKAEERLSLIDDPVSLLLEGSTLERLRFVPSWIDWPKGPLRDFIQAREERASDENRWAAEEESRNRPRSGGVPGY